MCVCVCMGGGGSEVFICIVIKRLNYTRNEKKTGTRAHFSIVVCANPRQIESLYTNGTESDLKWHKSFLLFFEAKYQLNWMKVCQVRLIPSAQSHLLRSKNTMPRKAQKKLCVCPWIFYI